MDNCFQLLDSIIVKSEIQCDKCNKKDNSYTDDSEACNYFYNKGWRIKEDRTLCPKCLRKKLNIK